jgi:hypothetical protein
MKTPLHVATLAALALLTIAPTLRAAEPRPLWDAPPPPKGFPKFKVQEIATDFKIGYAVHVCDVDGDKKPDIVVVDKERVVWYQNPTWKMRTILKGKTKPDNVCICSLDIDGDGKLDFVLGAGWKPMDTMTPGTLQWLRRKASLDDEWEMFPIPCDEPTVHRVQTREFFFGGRGESGFVMVPLMGRDATKEKNWMDGRPVNVLEYERPKDPTDPKAWKPRIISQQLHVIHNFQLGWEHCFGHTNDHYASYEGIHEVDLFQARKHTLLDAANQKDVLKSRGASEIAVHDQVIATIEPWHGNQVVVYHPQYEEKDHIRYLIKRPRTVVDERLRWGHAVKLSHLIHTPDRENEPLFIIAGVRDNPDPKQGDTFTEKRGVRLYRCTDGKGEKWDRYLLEDGGVAVEDLQVADLNGDGKPDIVAVGRATGNCRIYWNQGE